MSVVIDLLDDGVVSPIRIIFVIYIIFRVR